MSYTEVKHVKQLILNKQRRLFKLKEKMARLGQETPVSIELEIEDLEEEIQNLEIQLKEILEAEENRQLTNVAIEKSQSKQSMTSHLPLEPPMILIPGGDFLMGSDPQKDQNAKDQEQPQHRLFLPDYYMAKTPVTNAQYRAFVKATGYTLPLNWKNGMIPLGRLDHPVVWVSWHDAVAYCNWLSDITNKLYRLPSEAEWEKGSRGSDGRIYPWSYWWKPVCGLSNCGSTQSPKEIGKERTTSVEAFPDGSSPYGLLNMAGNVWEWCATKRGKTYPYDVQENEWSPDYLNGTEGRATRGGSWYSSQGWVRCAVRNWSSPAKETSTTGFRLVSVI